MRYNWRISGLWLPDYRLRLPKARGFAQLRYNFLPGHFPAGIVIVPGATPQDTGWVIAGAGANVDVSGDGSWINPENITASDDNRAGTPFQGTGDLLKASDFGLNVPGGATITGVETRAELRSSDGGGGFATYDYVNIGKDDSTLGTAKDPDEITTDSDALYDNGGSNDLWDLSLTPSDVNSSDFQVRIGVDVPAGPSNPDAECDAIWVKVHYLA